MNRTLLATLVALCLAPSLATARVPPGTYSAQIFVDGDRAGEVQFTRKTDANGRTGRMESEVSISVLGFEVFEFEQTLHEEWEDGRLQSMEARTDDDGDIYEVVLHRREGRLRGTLNGEPVTLPEGAYPTSVWHYEITRRDLLFDIKDLELRRVEVERSIETLEVDGEAIECERFDYVEGWDATIWYDQDQHLVRFRYTQHGYDVVVVPER
jgi:hypothetical protein